MKYFFILILKDKLQKLHVAKFTISEKFIIYLFFYYFIISIFFKEKSLKDNFF